MGPILLTIHNILRWLVIVFAVIAIVRAFTGWLGGRPWRYADDRAGVLYTMVFELQVLVGIILFIYPGTYTRLAFGDFGNAMSTPAIRFFAIEHTLLMLVALGIAHIPRSLSKKAADSPVKHRRAAIWFTVSLLLVLAAVPWPFLDYGRPLLRFFGLL